MEACRLILMYRTMYRMFLPGQGQGCGIYALYRDPLFHFMTHECLGLYNVQDNAKGVIMNCNVNV